MNSISVLLAFSLTLSGGTDPVDEHATWSQWRGPNGTGISPETEWVSEGKEKDLWSSFVGLGYSSMVIGNGRLYTMGYDADAKLDVVYCLDARSGEEIWAEAYPAEIWNLAHAGGTVNTPTLDGDKLFTLNREGSLYCFDAKSGEILWQQALKDANGLTYHKWGFSGSPLVSGENLILNVGKVMSVNKNTGKTNWISKEYGHAYSTPLAVEQDGKQRVVVFNGGFLAMLDLESGAEVCSLEFPPVERGVNAASPIQVQDALLISSGPIGGARLLAFGEDQFEEVWTSKKMKSSWAASILINEHVYGFDNGSMKCLDLQGEEIWKERGHRVGALAAAGERLIILNDKGALVIAEAKPEGYVELSSTQIFDDEDGEKWSTPVIAGGLIYCRASNGSLVCRDHRAGN